MLNIKDLISEWALKNTSEEEYIQSLRLIWSELRPSSDAVIAQYVSKDSELVIESSNHALLSNLQFQTLDLINAFNNKLSLLGRKKVAKLRFRFATGL